MTRILVLDHSDERFALFDGMAAAAGYQLVHAVSMKRLGLELRAAPTSAIVACADMQSGNGLELVRDQYRHLETPLPILAFSAKLSVAALIDCAPPSLLLRAVVGPDAAPELLLDALLHVSPPDDIDRARKVLAASQDAAPSATKTHFLDDGPRTLDGSGAAKMLAAMHRAAWSGSVEVHDLECGTLVCDLFEGALVGIRSESGGDLVDTARAQGRLAGITLPQVTLTDAEEEIGLLMAMRALGPHEVPLLHKGNLDRLLGMLLANLGATATVNSKSRPPRASSTDLLPYLLDGAVKTMVALAPLPNTPLSVDLPKASHRGLTGVSADVVRSLSQPPAVGSLDALIKRLAGDDQSRHEAVLMVLGCLRDLGYVSYAVGLFEAGVADQLEKMTRDLHTWSRASHFDILGVERDAGDRAVRDRMRKLSLLYHPDRLQGAHPRVLDLAEIMYAKVQQVFSEAETSQLRAAYRSKLDDIGDAALGGVDKDSAQVAMAQGTILVKQKRYGEAAQLYRDATVHDPAIAEAHMWLGWCRYLSEPTRVQECISSLQRALTLNSRLRDAYFYLGRVHLLEKDYLQARQFFTKANTPPLGEPDAAGHPSAASELRLMDSRDLGNSQSEAEQGAEQHTASKGLFSRFRKR